MELINKTMDREDLNLPEAVELSRILDATIYQATKIGLPLSSWVGRSVTSKANPKTDSRNPHHYDNYTPLPRAMDDDHFPWFLYWEIFWTLKHTPLVERDKILDAGGAGSLFSTYVAQLGYHLISVELDKELVAMSNEVSRRMRRRAIAIKADISNLSLFTDGMFDVIFSICVFEHLDYELRVKALAEFGRILKPGGYLTLTFDYKNPLPAVWYPVSSLDLNLISTPEQLRSSLINEDLFEVRFNKEFHDNGKLYLGHPKLNYSPYTFGALFLQRR